MRRSLAAVLTLALLTVGLGASPASARAGAPVPNIDNNDRAQVAATYRSAIESNMLLNPSWSGSTANCVAGDSTAEYDAATVESINWFRSMAGLNPVTEDPAQSAAAQQAALMMEAQWDLSHHPSTNWACYSSVGARTAGVSNLTLGITGPRGVVGQIQDPGSANEALGHRRWLLYPELTTVGVANTSAAGAIQIINQFGSRHSENEWVMWPPPGFVPDEVVFPRWSMSYAGAGKVDLSAARVSVTGNGKPLNVRVLPIHHNFGDPTLGWEVSGATPTAAGDVVYEVSVNGVLIDGRPASRNYTVTSFDASANGGSQPGPFCNGLQATIVGTNGDDNLEGTPGVDVIVGLGGNDVIDGLAGSDVICGGGGDDLIRAGWGHDVVFGGPGKDSIRGSRGNDVLNGGNGRDRIEGGTGADTLIGGAHNDTLVGNLGRDVCWGRVVNQTVSTNDTVKCELGR